MTVKNFQKVAVAMSVTALLMNPCNALAADFDGNEESSVKKMSALVNPSGTRKINYTQDGANSQENSMVVFQYAPNQLYKIYCRVGYLTDLALKKDERKRL